MDAQKMMRSKTAICDRLEQMEPQDLAKPTMVEYYKNLASLHCKLCQIEDAEGGMSMRSMRSSYRDTPEWGAYDDGMSMRRGRNPATGRYVSMSDGSPRAELERLMQDPNLSREEREALRRAMEQMR